LGKISYLKNGLRAMMLLVYQNPWHFSARMPITSMTGQFVDFKSEIVAWLAEHLIPFVQLATAAETLIQGITMQNLGSQNHGERGLAPSAVPVPVPPHVSHDTSVQRRMQSFSPKNDTSITATPASSQPKKEISDNPVGPGFRQIIPHCGRSSPDDPCYPQSNFRLSSPHATTRPRVIAIF